jgi:hypothetical protein
MNQIAIASLSSNYELSVALNGELSVPGNKFSILSIRIINYCLIIVFLSSLISCSTNFHHKVEKAFYYWQGNFQLTKSDIKYLEDSDVKKLYVRFFDVDWNSEKNIPEPAGDVNIQTDSLQNIELVPCIFITNRTLISIKDTLVDSLSQNISKKIINILTNFKKSCIKEIQLDCDWTKGTKDKYFRLILGMKKILNDKNISITATIRLHQVKYFKVTGVPPIKRGMLMFYNMSPVSEIKTKNSIFNPDVAKKYLDNFDKYPLPLDVALPAFSWGALYRRDKIIALINNLTVEKISCNSDFQKLDKTHYMALKDEMFEGQFIKKYDSIRIEEITPETTKLAAGIITPYIKNDSLTVAIYHFNEELKKNYETKDLQNIFSVFH